MPVKTTDRLRQRNRLSASGAFVYINRFDGMGHPEEVARFIVELYRLLTRAEIDFLIGFALAVEETTVDKIPFASYWWREKFNPAGIGIHGDAGDASTPSFLNGTNAARALAVDLAARVYDGVLPSFLLPYQELDFHLQEYLDAGYPDGTFQTIQDLAGKRATDPDYANQIVAHATKILTETNGGLVAMPAQTATEEIVFGRVKHPPFVDRLVLDSETAAYDNLGPMVPVGVCQHSMVGSLWGTDGWFRRGRGVSTGLTSYGIGNATDGPEWDGVIFRWNDPRGAAHDVNYKDPDGDVHTGRVSPNRSGWANGGSDGLEGDGPLFVRTLGVDAINSKLVSIERSDGGRTDTPMSEKQFESICQLSAYWFDQAHVPWNTFPLNPELGIVTHLLHFEFATKSCPHAPVTNRIDEIQNRIRQILKDAQTSEIAVDPVPPVTPPKPDHDKFPWPLEEIEARFGKLMIVELDGSVSANGFSPNGAISNAWIARAVKEKRMRLTDVPKPLRGLRAQDAQGNVQTLITFDGKGRGYWALMRASEKAAWKWIA